MKAKLKDKLAEASEDQLIDILDSLCSKYKFLEAEIEFVLSPKKIKETQSYYNRFVKQAIDTNSWSKFPNKGIDGLNKCLDRLRVFENVGNRLEAKKIAEAILIIINKCKSKYNNHNIEDLARINQIVSKYLFFDIL
jgi:hypothetical protein